jgi:hypothetical protein
MASRAYRLYVFGVTFTALFLLAFLAVAIVAADARPAASASQSLGTSDSATATRQAALTEYRSARGEVGRALRRLGIAEKGLFQFMYDRVVGPVEPAPRQATVPANQPVKTTAAANSPLADLEHGLADLKLQREKLLDRLTPSHPMILALDASIADVEQRLEAVKNSTQADSPRVDLGLPVAVGAEQTGGDDETQASVASRERLTGLMIAAGRAQRDFALATEKERSKLGELTRAVNALALAPTPKTANGVMPPRPILAICMAFTLATIGGIAAARAARRTERTFASAMEVESCLGLPILGRLAIAGGASGTPAIESQLEAAWSRRSLKVCELFLAITLGAVVVLALINLPLARHFAADPLTGLSEGIVKMRGLAGK